MTPEEDLRYIDQVLNGNVQAYRHLVDAYRDIAFTIALKLMRHYADAEEVVQLGFLKAYEQLYTFKGQAKFSTWLYTIMYRTALEQLRKRSITSGRLEVLNDQVEIAAGSENPMYAKDRQFFVRQAFDQLPKMEGLIITLFYLNENSIEEIREITGLSTANIKVKLFRARKTLKKILENTLPDAQQILKG